MKKVSTFELLKTRFCSEAISQQAHSAKFQAKIAVYKRVLKSYRKNILPVAGKKAKTCARAFRTNCGKDYLFAAIAATTIRAILPFSLRLCECFFLFSKKTRIKISNAILVADFKPSFIRNLKKSKSLKSIVMHIQ